jgi:hypothetical protein
MFGGGIMSDASESMDLNNEEVRKKLTKGNSLKEVKYEKISEQDVEDVNKFQEALDNLPILTNDQAGDMKCSCRVLKIDNFSKLLTPAAKAIYDFPAVSTVEEYLELKVLDKEDFEVEEYRRILFCQFFAKPFYMENNQVPKWVVEKTAAAFNKLVAEHKLGHGVLGPAMIMKIHDEVTKVPDGEGNYVDRDKVRERGLIVFYPFPSKELEDWANRKSTTKYNHFEIVKDQLNKTLGSECFVEEGAIGDIEWDSLPDLEKEENNE